MLVLILFKLHCNTAGIPIMICQSLVEGLLLVAAGPSVVRFVPPLVITLRKMKLMKHCLDLKRLLPNVLDRYQIDLIVIWYILAIIIVDCEG